MAVGQRKIRIFFLSTIKVEGRRSEVKFNLATDGVDKKVYFLADTEDV